MSWLISVLVLTVVVALIYRAFEPRPLPYIPHNKRLTWFAGDIPYLARIAKDTGSITRAFDTNVKNLGPISQVVVGTGKSWLSKLIGFGEIIVVVSDSQEIHDILVNRPADFDRAKAIAHMFEATVPQGLLGMPTHDRFKLHKRRLGISMTSPYLARMVPRMTESVMELIDLWSLCSRRLVGESATDQAFSAMDDFKLATIDLIASIAFGSSFGSIRAAIDFLGDDVGANANARPATSELPGSFEILMDVIGDGALFPFPAWLPFITKNFNRRWSQAKTTFDAFLGSKVDAAKIAHEALEQEREKFKARDADNVLDMILEAEREERLKGGEALTRSEILDELASYMLGGSETTATTMQWSVKILARHPEVQHKLRQELIAGLPPLGGRTWTYEELCNTERLPYLSAVMNELLRTGRPAGAVARDTIADTTILGYPVPRGTQVILTIGYTQQYEDSSYRAVSESLHSERSESSRKRGRKYGYWCSNDASEFRPERWLDEDGSFNPNAGPWMPFSLGFRGCFGQKLAVLQLRLFLVLIQLSFFLDVVPEELDGWAARESVTNHPTQCYVRPIPWLEIDP